MSLSIVQQKDNKTMSKRKSLQPWLDYFEMLHTYEQKGYLEVKPEKHEAYITRAALCTLSPTPALPEGEGVAANTHVIETVRRIRAYTAYLSAVSVGAKYPVELSDEGVTAPPIPASELKECMDQPFALHIVKEDALHDPLCTLLLTRRRVWWRVWRKTDSTEVITYSD
jgi:hypothetical protein